MDWVFSREAADTRGAFPDGVCQVERSVAASGWRRWWCFAEGRRASALIPGRRGREVGSVGDGWWNCAPISPEPHTAASLKCLFHAPCCSPFGWRFGGPAVFPGAAARPLSGARRVFLAARSRPVWRLAPTASSARRRQSRPPDGPSQFRPGRAARCGNSFMHAGVRSSPSPAASSCRPAPARCPA